MKQIMLDATTYRHYGDDERNSNGLDTSHEVLIHNSPQAKKPMNGENEQQIEKKSLQDWWKIVTLCLTCCCFSECVPLFGERLKDPNVLQAWREKV
jgi:hypothetical protein